MEGLRIDHRKIGTGIYNMLNEEDKTIVSFGMLPANMMSMLEGMLREKITKIWAESNGVDLDQEGTKELAGHIQGDIIKDTMHEISVEIFNAAEGRGRMRV